MMFSLRLHRLARLATDQTTEIATNDPPHAQDSWPLGLQYRDPRSNVLRAAWAEAADAVSETRAPLTRPNARILQLLMLIICEQTVMPP
jgi:hypothetical protein